MADNPSQTTDTDNQTPAPETLTTRAAEASSETTDASKASRASARPTRRLTYQPSHKATFIGLAAVVVILAINAGALAFILRSKTNSTSSVNKSAVTISSDALSKVGVNQTPVGTSGIQLVVNPNAKFNGTLTVGGDTSIAGSLRLNSSFAASSASLSQLQAGDTTLQKLSVNGDSSFTNLALRNDLSVTGASHFQGSTTFSQLVTVNNNLNITGNASVGGTLSVNSFHAASLVSDTTLTIGGHIITAGLAPSVSAGSSLGALATVGISGNDAAGTVSVNTGVAGGGGGAVATVTFRQRYATTPHVVVTPGGNVGSVWVGRSSSGFTIYVSGSMPAGGYIFDYIVEQ